MKRILEALRQLPACGVVALAALSAIFFGCGGAGTGIGPSDSGVIDSTLSASVGFTIVNASNANSIEWIQVEESNRSRFFT